MSFTCCNDCDLYKDGHCIKWRKNGTPDPSHKGWFDLDGLSEPKEFISVNRMCRRSSIFGNEFIGLTNADVERLKNGEVIHIGGEYGTFIGYIED